MNILIITIFSVIIVIIIFICSIVLAKSAVSLSVDKSNYNDVKGKNYLDISTIIGWITIGLIILSIIVVYTTNKGDPKSLEIFINIFFGLLIGVFLIIGILTLMAAIYISKGSSHNANKDEFNSCIWISVIYLGSILIVIIYYLTDYFSRKKSREKYQEISSQKRAQI